MRKAGLPMSTARGVALLRVMEMHYPDAERLSSDPYAKSFVNPLFVQFTRAWVASGIANLVGLEPMMNFAVARERYVHDAMVEALKEGLDQIVILGAGFDTRAYRLPGLGTTRVLEVDHPVTQAQKRQALRGVVEPKVTFVPVDFNSDDLGERLRAAGYSESAKTLFVWQGVIMYLAPEGIDHTLEFIARHSGPGSTLVFDTFHEGVLKGSQNAAIALFTRALGERITFGLAPTEIAPFLERRGFADVTAIDGAGLKQLYSDTPTGRRPMALDAAIVTARVRGTSP